MTDQLPGRTVIIEGKERLYFSGTSYLGINRNPEFQQLLAEGIQCYGTNYGSSRASNLQLSVYEEAEALLTTLTGVEAALTFSSGYLAGQAVVQMLQQGQPFSYAPETHPAMWRSQEDSRHGDYKTWTLGLPAAIAAVKKQAMVIVSNSLDPLLAEKYRFDWIHHLPADRRITLLIDDSHGFGILGKNGEGIYPEIKALLKPNISLIIVSSLGKAYGIPGGVVFGASDFINALKKSLFFTAASPIPPAYLYAFVRAQAVYAQARKQLVANVSYFQEQIKDYPFFHYFDHYPVFYTPENALAPAVEEQCILSSFPYPHPDSDPVTRVVINSLHLPGDMDILSSRVAHFVQLASRAIKH